MSGKCADGLCAVLTYFLSLLYLAVTHMSAYIAIWHTTIHRAPWFVEPTYMQRPVSSKSTNEHPREPYENPAFRAEDHSDNHSDDDSVLPTRPRFVLNSREADLERLEGSQHDPDNYRSPPSPAHSADSLRPMWARQVSPRRGVDMPFAPLPVAQRFSRLVKSYWRASGTDEGGPPVLPPKPSLPVPRDLDGGFLGFHRKSYGLFPDSVPDQDKPIAQPRRSEWVTARR